MAVPLRRDRLPTAMPRKPTLAHEHTPEAIAERLTRGPGQSHLRDWVYGGVDGAVTTFAVVSGVTGAQLEASTVLILGMANLLADGFSMAAGNYLGTKAEEEELSRIRDFEQQQVRMNPDGEREEVRQILKSKGFSGTELENAVRMYTSKQDRWVQMMLTEEYGLPFSVRSPFKAALSTFSAFTLCGLVPLIPYLFGTAAGGTTGGILGDRFAISSILTCVVFFTIGSTKSRWSLSPWWRSGLTTLAIGAGAAGLAYFVGVLLGGLSS